MRYRHAKKLLWSIKTPRVKSALARVSAKQRERVARAGSIRSAAHRRRWRVRSNARWFKAWKRRPSEIATTDPSTGSGRGFGLYPRGSGSFGASDLHFGPRQGTDATRVKSPVVEPQSVAEQIERGAHAVEQTAAAMQQLRPGITQATGSFRRLGLLLAALAFGSIGDPES